MAQENNEKLKLVLESQILIAQSLKIDKEITTFLQTISEWERREWYFVCALDGMTGDEIQKLEEEKASISQIKRARAMYLKNLYTDRDTISRDVERLQKEVEETNQRSDKLKQMIEDNLEAALKREAEIQKQLLEEKDQRIAALCQENDFLKEQIGSFQKEKKSSQTEKNDKAANEDAGKTKPVVKGFWKNRKIQKQLNLWLKDPKMSAEQKDFIIDCLEEGLSVTEIEKFASADLSVPVMQRLKKLGEKKDV